MEIGPGQGWFDAGRVGRWELGAVTISGPIGGLVENMKALS
jgi:hypothetical protein